MAANLISICQTRRPSYCWLNEVFVSGIQQKLVFATHEPLDYQAAKRSISNWWKFITTPERSKEIGSIWMSAWHLSYLQWTWSLGSFAEHKWSYLLDWTHSSPPPPHFRDKSHPLKEYDSALNVLPEILMSGPIARFHCNKCWYTFMWWSCLHSWGCFSAGSTINSFKGRSELNQTDIYHRVMEDI